MTEADDRIRLARDGSWIIWEDPQLSELMDDLFAAVDERDALRALLQRLEWSGTYSYCTGWPCCQICKGIKPGHGRDEHGDLPDASGHRNECALAKALERNR